MKTETFTNITRKLLSDKLELVGWKLKSIGAGFYVFVNPYGYKSDITFRAENEDSIIYDIRVGDFYGYENNLFGKTNKNYIKAGFCSFILKGCQLDVNYENNEPDFVSITSKPVEDCNQPSFICFKKKFISNV